jgi:hypothetical protein
MSIFGGCGEGDGAPIEPHLLGMAFDDVGHGLNGPPTGDAALAD